MCQTIASVCICEVEHVRALLQAELASAPGGEAVVVARGEGIAGPAEEELGLTASAKDAMLAQSQGAQALNGLLAKACAAAAAEQRAVPQLAKQCAMSCVCVCLHHIVWMRCLKGLYINAYVACCVCSDSRLATNLDVCFLRQSAAHAAGV